MAASYAVTWREPAGPVYAGKLELAPTHLRLEGVSERLRFSTQTVFYGDVLSARIARESAERIGGRPVLVLERRSGPPIRLTSVDASGTIYELAERIRAGEPAAARG